MLQARLRCRVGRSAVKSLRNAKIYLAEKAQKLFRRAPRIFGYARQLN
jgi:hypothetical protein